MSVLSNFLLLGFPWLSLVHVPHRQECPTSQTKPTYDTRLPWLANVLWLMSFSCQSLANQHALLWRRRASIVLLIHYAHVWHASVCLVTNKAAMLHLVQYVQSDWLSRYDWCHLPVNSRKPTCMRVHGAHSNPLLYFVKRRGTPTWSSTCTMAEPGGWEGSGLGVSYCNSQIRKVTNSIIWIAHICRCQINLKLLYN